MRAVFWLTFAIFLGNAAQAQQVTVRAGDHEEFTRIVLRLPDQLDWRLGRVRDGYGLELSEPVEFETSSFFSLIQKNRVEDIRVDDDGKRIAFLLNCECVADAFLTETRWLVIDIGLGNPDPNSPFEEAMEESLTATPDLDLSGLPDPPALIANDLGAEPTTSTDPVAAVALPIVIDRPKPRVLPMDDVLQRQVEQSERLALLEQAVGESLERALSQGLLDPSGEVEVKRAPDAEDPLERLLDDVARLRGPGITARTSLDLPVSEGETDTTGDNDPKTCADVGQFQVADWGTDDPFAHQIALARDSLVGEFDRPNSQRIEDLARLYIHFGFGREARAVLNIDGLQSAERLILTSLAQIVDGDPVEDAEFVENLLCSGPAHFWGMLAHSDGPFPFQIDGNNVVETFRTLPVHLQRHLGPRVAQRLRQAGEAESARIVLGASLDGPSVRADATVERGQQLLAEGETDQAVAALESVVESNSEVAPETLLQLLDLKIAENTPIELADLMLLRTMLFEQTDERLQADLVVMEVRALAHMQDFGGALSRLEANSGQIGPEMTVQLSDAILRDIVEATSDIDFLGFILDDGVSSNDPELQNRVAARLLDLGFLAQAEEVVAAQTVGSPMAERRYIRAEIAARSGDADRVSAELSGIQSERARLLKSQVGLVDDPSQLEPELAEEFAWRTADWASLLEGGDQVFRAAAERAISAPSDPMESDAPLSSSETLIAESEELRTTIDELLQRFIVD